jgi:hypothetical protein
MVAACHVRRGDARARPGRGHALHRRRGGRGRPRRAPIRAGRRSGATQSGHSAGSRRAGGRPADEGHAHHSDRVFGGQRPGRRRLSEQPGAAGRQRHRLGRAGARTGDQAARAAAPGGATRTAYWRAGAPGIPGCRHCIAAVEGSGAGPGPGVAAGRIALTRRTGQRLRRTGARAGRCSALARPALHAGPCQTDRGTLRRAAAAGHQCVFATRRRPGC